MSARIRFFVTACKGIQTYCRHIDAEDMAQHLVMLARTGWLLVNIERVETDNVT